MIYQSTPNHYLQTYIERGRAYRREYWRTQRKHLLIVLAIIVIGVSYLLATPSLNRTVFVWDDEADYTSSARSDISQDARGVTWVTEVSGGIDRFKTLAALAQRGHTVQPITGRGRGVFGSGQIIIRDAETGLLYGGSDPRKDGLVAAY